MAAESQPSPPSDPGLFDRWRKRFAFMTGLGITENEKFTMVNDMQGSKCEKWKREMMNYSQY